MIIALEVVGSAIAFALLFFPVLTLPAALQESGFLLAYIIIAVLIITLVSLAYRFWRRQPTWADVRLFFSLALIVGGAFSILAWMMAQILNVVDSSHGWSVILVVLAALGSALIATICLVERKRRAGAH